MKINKLLFFLLALISFNSCVEYVDNGKNLGGPQLPQEQKYTAVHSNKAEAKYVGDRFEFKAMLNDVDVTSTTKFKVNGTQINGNTYLPHKTGSHSVIANMDNFEASFKFTVLEKGDEEPQPTGNRIELDGDSKPVTTTFWLGYGDPDEGFTPYNVTLPGATSPTACTKWMLVSMDHASNPSEANNVYIVSDVFIPVDITDPNKPKVNFPHQTSNFYYTDTSNIGVVFDGDNQPASSNTFNFISGTMPDDTSLADYTATAKLQSGKDGKLFWNGKYNFQIIPEGAKSAKGINMLSKVDFTKSLDVRSLKLNMKK